MGGIRGVCKACLAIRQLAFLRVVARLRTDSSHERTLVPFRECAVLHWQSIPQWGSGSSFSLCPSLLSLILFLLVTCIDAPESATNSRSAGLFEVKGVDIPLTSPGT